MARYSRRRGPTVDFTILTTLADIPDISLTRFFDDGELLIAIRGVIANTLGVQTFIEYQVTIDGVAPLAFEGGEDILAGNQVPINDVFITPITRGIHTIAVQVVADDTPGVDVQATSVALSVIQLPLWDKDDDVL